MKYKYSGLSDKDVLESRSKYGSNSLPTPEIESFLDNTKLHK
jgi:hypothetical protein